MSFSENCRNCSVIVDNGTGVFIQPNTEDYSYIFTAKHNLYEDYEKKKCTEPKSLNSIKLVAYDESIELSIIEKYELDECDNDIVILKIKKVDIFSPKIISDEINIGDKCFLYGFPKNRRDKDNRKEEKIRNFELKIVDEPSYTIVENDTYYAQTDIDGCSGGGVFKNIEDKAYLIGIEFRMDRVGKKDENNIRLRYFSIKVFDEIVEKYSDELISLNRKNNDLKNQKKQKSNIVEEISNDKKAPKEVRESAKKVLEYLYIIKKHPIWSGIILTIFIGWTFPNSIYTGIKSFIDSNSSENKIDIKEKADTFIHQNIDINGSNNQVIQKNEHFDGDKIINNFLPKDNIQPFYLTMQRLSGNLLLEMEFFDNNECKIPSYNKKPLVNGKYELSLLIEKGKSKIIYIQNELIKCRELQLDTNSDTNKFECYIDCNKNEKDDECKDSSVNPICNSL